MAVINTEAWSKRQKSDENYRDELFSLFSELRKQAKINIEFYKDSKAQNGDRFYTAFSRLQEHLQLNIESGIAKILVVAHQFDFDPHLPSNGYRSFVKIIHKCCLHLLQLSRHIATNRGSLFFRSGHYSRELTAYVTTLGQLRACLYYLFKLMSYCTSGELIPDEENLKPEQVIEAQGLMKEVEALSQECFYGRCLGFQYCHSMQKHLMTICIFMASFSDGYLCEKSSMLMKVANSILGGSKYVMDPELRGQKIVEVTRNCDIKFCQAFWAMNENDVMHTLPLFACPPVQLDKVIAIPPETFELPLARGSGKAQINPPCSHTGPGPVNCRLISYELREGQETWKYGVNNKSNNIKMLPPSSGLLIHFHGGGFVAQSSASHEVYLRHWAKELHVPIFCIDYSLAPKYPFPRAFEESFFAYCWAVKNAKALGSTGERVCVCGDSAGANLAMAVAIHANSVGVRLPDGIQTTYGCQLMQYTPSPSRVMALMDPLLPLGIISRCLAAYAGLTEQTGVNAPMGASITKQTIFEMEEQSELEKQRQIYLQEQALELQEQTKRLQRQAKELLEETHRLRMRSSKVQYDAASSSYSLGPQSGPNSPTKSCQHSAASSRTSSIRSHGAYTQQQDSFSLESGSNSPRKLSMSASPTKSTNTQEPCDSMSQAKDQITKSCPDVNKSSDITPKAQKDQVTEANSSSILCDSTKVSSKSQSTSVVAEFSDVSLHHDTHTVVAEEATETLNDQEIKSDTKLQDTIVVHVNIRESCDSDVKTSESSANNNAQEPRAISSNNDLGTNNENLQTKDNTIEKVSPQLGHKSTGSNDSGFLDLTTKPHTLQSNSIFPSIPAVISPQSLPEVCKETNIDEIPTSNIVKQKKKDTLTRNQLTLDLATCRPLAKSPSTPAFGVQDQLSVGGSLISPESRNEYSTPHGSLSTPHELHAPSYAKVRHIAQSPVEQLTQIPMSRNPYMSPFLADDSMLTDFPPVYFICCDLDPMLDESVQMAKRLRDLGNEVHLDVLADLPHGFLNFALISHDARQGSQLCVRRIRQILQTDDEGIFHMDGDNSPQVEDFEILDPNEI